MRMRSKAVALSISLVVAASGAGTAAMAGQGSPAGKDDLGLVQAAEASFDVPDDAADASQSGALDQKT
jgi:hypothetical protein